MYNFIAYFIKEKQFVSFKNVCNIETEMPLYLSATKNYKHLGDRDSLTERQLREEGIYLIKYEEPTTHVFLNKNNVEKSTTGVFFNPRTAYEKVYLDVVGEQESDELHRMNIQDLYEKISPKYDVISV